MKRVNILLGGPKTEYPQELSSIKAVPGPWVGADKGSLYLLEQGIIPEIAIGDFDSISKKEQKLLKENERLKMENEILKKAAAYFAKHPADE